MVYDKGVDEREGEFLLDILGRNGIKNFWVIFGEGEEWNFENEGMIF